MIEYGVFNNNVFRIILRNISEIQLILCKNLRQNGEWICLGVIYKLKLKKLKENKKKKIIYNKTGNLNFKKLHQFYFLSLRL